MSIADALLQLVLFSAKIFIVVLFILIIFLFFFALLAKAKHKTKGKLVVKNLNEHYEETGDLILHEILPKKEYKEFLKEKKRSEKNLKKSKEKKQNVYVIHFIGDIRASAVEALREEVTAILTVAKETDEVVVCVESAGGVVHGYGLAASQLQRIRERKIPLTVTIDKVAASGGYLMSCVANKIIAAPFAIIGSIGVIVQLPNFHRLLKDKNIDFEQLTAGEYKRTLTLFGENTEEGRHKLQQEIEEVQELFKNLITQHRPQIDIKKVATGEHWLAQQAIALNLVDELKTSDAYLLERSQEAHLFEICYEMKKSFMSKLTNPAGSAHHFSVIPQKPELI